MTLQQQLSNYLGNRYSSLTVSQVLGQARHYLTVNPKPTFSQPELVSYVNLLVGRGLKPASVRTMINRLRIVYRALGAPWPVGARDLHVGGDVSEGGVVMAQTDVLALIRGVKGISTWERPALALSTVYGLRTAEIAWVLAHGVKGGVMEVPVKMGRKRHHTIPPELAPYLLFRPKALTPAALRAGFKRVMERGFRPALSGEDYHSVRRALVTGLLDRGLPLEKVYRFMGWKAPNTPFVYYRPDPAKVDEEVWRVHPFLGEWVGGTR